MGNLRKNSPVLAVALIVALAAPADQGTADPPRGGAPWTDPVPHNVTLGLSHGQRSIPVDLDGDTDLDLICSYSFDDSVTIAFNTNGDASAWNLVRAGGNIVATFAAPFDADCDGDTDIAAVELFDRAQGFESAGRVVWYERPDPVASPNWPETIIDDTLIHYIYLDVADIDTDGDDDLAVVTNSSSVGNSVLWYENRCGEGPPRWQRWTVAGAASFGAAGSVRLARLDADAFPDLLVADRTGGAVWWFASEANPRRDGWTRHTVAGGLGAPSSARPYDVDGDGDLDALVADSGGSAVAWYEHPPAATTTPWPAHPVASLVGVRDAVCALIDGDALLDIAAGTPEPGFGGTDTFAIFTNNGNGTYTRRMTDGNYFSFTAVEAADLDGDEDADFVTSSYGGDRIDWWENVNGGDPPVVESSGVSMR